MSTAVSAGRALRLLLALRVRRLFNALFFGARPPRVRGAPLDLLRAALRLGVAFTMLMLTVAPMTYAIGDLAARQRDGAIVQELEVDPPSDLPLEVIRPVRTRWVPEPHAPGATLPKSSLRTQHLVLLVLLALLAFTELASTRVDRAPPDLELLAALPLGPSTIFTLRVLDESLLSLVGFFEVTPGLAALAWVAGHRWGALPLAAALTPFLVLPLVQARTVAEVNLRTRLDARRLRNVRALVVLVVCVGGMVLVGGTMLTCGGNPADLLIGVRESLAGWMWLPPGLVLRVLAAPTLPAAASWVALLFLETLAALALGARALRSLTASGVDPFAVREAGRDHPPARDRAPGPRRLLTPVVAKLVTHLARDWSYLTHAFLVPGAIAIFELLMFSGLARIVHVTLSAGAIAAAGLATGAWVLNTGLLHTMLEERGTLWLLCSLPRRLERAVAELALAWGLVAALPALGLLAVALAVHAPPPVESLALIASVIIGLALLVVIAGCCSLLDGTELPDMPQTRTSSRYQILFMNVTLPLVAAVWMGHWWYIQAVLLLDAALAYALVQRLRERAPYFLDPHAEAPGGITLLDALIGVHVYFQVQVVAAIALIRGLAADPLTAFCIASALGGAFTMALARVVMRLRGAPSAALTPWVFARASDEAWLGVKLGLAAGSAALARLAAAIHRGAGDVAAQLGAVAPDARLPAFALAVLVAPWVEEFLFRGLLYTGLRRSAGAPGTIAATAVLFAMLHPAVSALPVLMLGLLTGWTRERTGGLMTGTVVHAVFNAVLLSAQLR